MIGISFGEIIVILIVILLFINPKDIPHIIKYIKYIKSHFNKLHSEFESITNKILSETEPIAFNEKKELDEINHLLKEICDNGGQYDGDYDLKKIKIEHKKIISVKKNKLKSESEVE
jgi:Sec-independent protein translocase protein TatA